MRGLSPEQVHQLTDGEGFGAAAKAKQEKTKSLAATAKVHGKQTDRRGGLPVAQHPPAPKHEPKGKGKGDDDDPDHILKAWKGKKGGKRRK